MSIFSSLMGDEERQKMIERIQKIYCMWNLGKLLVAFAGLVLLANTVLPYTLC